MLIAAAIKGEFWIAKSEESDIIGYQKEGEDMREREQAIQIIKEIPDSKLVFIVDMLRSVKNLLTEETVPDEWDLEMMEKAKKENDGERVSLEELLERDGLTYADIQN